MGTVTKYGRSFEFDDDVDEATQTRRIEKWMKENAADELKGPQGEPAIVEGDDSKRGTYNPKLGAISAMLAGPFMPLAMHPDVQKRLGDINFTRTLAQGALPYVDEAVAGVRSILPQSWGGTDYDTALGEERQGVKDYEHDYGPTEAMGVQLLGGLGTLPMGGAAVQGASKLPMVGKLAAEAIKHPWIASILGGGAAGATAGFGAGEGGFDERLQNAGEMGLLGAGLGVLGQTAVQASKPVMNYLKSDNAVANFLRKQIAAERGVIDPLTKKPKEFDTDEVMSGMRKEFKERDQVLNTQPMVADMLPRTTEGVFQQSGPEVTNLAKNVLNRQFNRTMDNSMLAKDVGQHGRVNDAMDMAWGQDMFKKQDADILAARKADADAMFAPSYVYNINNHAIDDAMDKIGILDPGIIDQAKKWAEAGRRGIGFIDRQGVQRNYNTQYLHDIKRSMDQALGEAKRKNPEFSDIEYIAAKKQLNAGMKEANSGYKEAMDRFGSHSELEKALTLGREKVFVPGSVDNTGAMDAKAIKDYLNNPKISPEQKDLFLTGAARAARERFVNANSKKLTHNAADFINTGPTMDTLDALLGDKLTALASGPTINSWKLFQKKMATESQNYKDLIQSGLGNSRTAFRENMKKEIEGGDFNPGKLISAFVNPTAPSTWTEGGRQLLDKMSRKEGKLNKVAELLGRQGKTPAVPAKADTFWRKGTPRVPAKSALDDIESLLRGFDKRRDAYQRASAYAPYVGYAYPGREQ